VSSGVPYEPVRTCVGCRERHPQKELIRLRQGKTRLAIVQPGDDTEGRSLYLCAREGCWQRALKRGRLTFKSSKYDRRVVLLNLREQEALLARLKRHLRSRGTRS